MRRPVPVSALLQRARLLRWLHIGLGVKRWLALYLAALTLLALGCALLLSHLYRTTALPAGVYYVTLQFVPRLVRAVLLLAAGGTLMLWALFHLVVSFTGLLVPHYRGRLGKALYVRRVLDRGPKVVAIGGGTGISSLLRGLKEYTSNLTAVVTVCDDGGSSGRLRRDLRVLPPGDFRQCIAALADADPLVTKLFEHRFEGGASGGDGGGLRGHAFGNLFIAAMAQITGSFERALEESSRVLAVRGRILPSTLEDVTLCAELADNSTVQGESLIPEKAGAEHNGHVWHNDRVAGHSTGHGSGDQLFSTPPEVATPANPIRRVYLEPERPAVYPEVVRSLLDADLIVIGPGSLFTSILPNLLVDDLARALCWSRAKKVYVCNVATQPGETDHYDVVDHVNVLYQHLRNRLGVAVGPCGAPGIPDMVPPASGGLDVPFTHVLVNNHLSPHLPAEWGVTRPVVDRAALAELGVAVIEADVVDQSRPTRHDPLKLAGALMTAWTSVCTAHNRPPARRAGLRTAMSWIAGAWPQTAAPTG